MDKPPLRALGGSGCPEVPPAQSRSIRPGTIERAFQLAASGSCRSIYDLERKLAHERYEDVWEHLAGQLIKAQLRKAMNDAHSMQKLQGRHHSPPVVAHAPVPPAGASRG